MADSKARLLIDAAFEATSEAVGLAIIITNDYKDNSEHSHLQATESDGNAMAEAFTELGYAIVRNHNIDFFYMKEILRKSSDTQYQSCKRIAFVFAGHGRNEPKSGTTLLIMNDSTTIAIDSIVETLSPRDPNTIGNKVRMFFIDACRGEDKDEGRLVPRGGEDRIDGDCIEDHIDPEKQRISTNAANYLLAFSTLAGFKSFELQVGNGKLSQGLWLPRVARKLTTCDDSIGDVLIKVNQELLTVFQDKKKYEYMMQPVLIQTLNELVFLLREKPQGLSTAATTSSESSDKDQSKRPSAGQASRPELSAAFSQQTHRAQMHTTEQSLSRERAMSLPSTTELVQQKEPLPNDSGYYKKQLNELMHKKIITDSFTKSWKTEEHPKTQGKFKATVECVLVADKSIVSGKSEEYYDGKNLAKEMAAIDAVRKIEKILPGAVSASISSPPPIATGRSDIPVLTSKQNLNNYFQGELRDILPNYATVSVGNGFQCSITHRRFGSKTITGDVCSTKKEAENSAASKALKHCQK